MWRAAAAELSPEKSLARVDAKAQHVVTHVTVVGALLTGLGLVANGVVQRDSPVRWLAVAAVGAAVLAVVLAVGSSLLRFSPVFAPGNLLEVELWYRRQFRRARIVVAAGWLVLVGLAMAGASAVVILAQGPDAAEPMLAVETAGAGREAKLTVRAEFSGLDPGEVLRVEAVGAVDGGMERILGRAVVRAGAGGTPAARLEADDVAGLSAIEVTAAADGKRCTATLRLAPSSLVSTSTSQCRG
jgi:hypothetical protein